MSPFDKVTLKSINLTVDVKVIQAIMGHKNIKTTLEFYADDTIEKKQEFMENFSKIWDEKIMV